MASFTSNLLKYNRLLTQKVIIGSLEMGGEQPIVIQTMVTADTMQTEEVIQETQEVINSGAQLVRITTPSIKEAANLALIKSGLQKLGYTTPLVADVHFTPNAAEEAARHVEKIRINPGNFAERKTMQEALSEKEYAEHLSYIEEKLIPLIQICQSKQRTIRIGVNHGSLSQRILNRYGDTPQGMVESAMEYIRIFQKHNFHSIVVSMKSSNPIVMIHANRLLAQTMISSDTCYPIHLGVTEAGDGEDGRIKSAIGIGSLLEDGIGDTIRVSLTEPAANEIPVAQAILQRFSEESYHHQAIILENHPHFDPYSYNRQQTHAVSNIGGGQVPVVLTDLRHITQLKLAHFFGCGYRYDELNDKWHADELAPDIIYLNEFPSFSPPQQVKLILPFHSWDALPDRPENCWPVVGQTSIESIIQNKLVSTIFVLEIINFYKIDLQLIRFIKTHINCVLLIHLSPINTIHNTRAIFGLLQKEEIKNPVILHRTASEENTLDFTIQSAIDFGALLVDGFGDGISQTTVNQPLQHIRKTLFGILQASRTRISKTEYISCPSCGRTLFDLTETTAKIKAATEHLKGVKIGIMGCIVNGPGEMADADYGYVGSGPGKINLYKAKELVKRNIPEKEAVQELINLIKQHGDWRDQRTSN
jgi:(E)-4-hydroxy-3-methylbut-2-enyl-diphosphate synthase